MKLTTSEQLIERARRSIPGGVNSPVRAFKAVGGQPLFIDRGEGAYIVDDQGRRFLTEELERAELAPRDAVSRAIMRPANISGPP